MKLSDLFEAKLPTHDELVKLAQEFHDEMDGPTGKREWGATLSDCADEYGNCSMVSNTFIDWLEARGIKGSFISGANATNPKWAAVAKGPDDPDAHTAVRVGSTVIDFTARQFDKKLPNPRITDVGDFDEEWGIVDD
jgi:hypothetical protein